MMEYHAFIGNAVELRIQAAAGASRGDALQAAAMRGNLECVEILVGIETSPAALEKSILQAGIFEHGACVEAIARAPLLDKDRVLVEAAITGNILVVRALAPLGCGTMRRALREAAEFGHVDCMEALAAHATEEPDRFAALIHAVRREHVGCVRVLVDGVTAASRGDALLEAVMNNKPELVRAVLATNAPIEVGAPPEWCADAVAFALLVAAQGGDCETAAVILAKGAADASDRALVVCDTHPRLMPSPLMAAAEQGHEAMVELLLEAGAGKGAGETNEEGKTAIMLAAEQGHATCVRLLAAIAQPSHVCTPVASVFGLARKNGHQQCVDEMYRGMRLNQRVMARLGK